MLTHPDIVMFAFSSQGKYDEAVPLYKESLAIWKKVFGDEHPKVAIALNNFASLLKAQGKYDEAVPLFKESLAIKKKVHGNEHPSVATGLNNLAGLLKAQVRHCFVPTLSLFCVVELMSC